MKYRTKLYIALFSIAVLSTTFGISIIIDETYNWRRRELASKVVAISSTAAALIDIESLKTLTGTPVDENTPAYKHLVDQLRRARNNNQSFNVFVKYLYVIKPDPSDPTRFIFVVDAEENPLVVTHPGDLVPFSETNQLLRHENKKWATPNYYSDPWGIWLTGFTPIRDENGHYLGTMAADISAADIQKELNKIFYYGIAGLMGAILLALGGAFILSRQVTLSLLSLVDTVGQIGKGNLAAEAQLISEDEFSNLAEAINHMTKGLRERERLKMSFARYVSHHVMEKILSTEASLKLEGERKKVTILFSDIRQFTQLAEKLDPEKVVSLLNEYFEKMLDIVFKNHGTLDKFIGDGIMVEFGAPLEDPYQERHALITAIEMQKELQILCDKWEKEGKPRIDIGIGIHTGPAIVGNIGSERRMEYTAIGDTVNIAARLEQLTKTVKMPILVSETTYEAVKDQFVAKNLGLTDLHGKTEKITVYALELELPPPMPSDKPND